MSRRARGKQCPASANGVKPSSNSVEPDRAGGLRQPRPIGLRSRRISDANAPVFSAAWRGGRGVHCR